MFHSGRSYYAAMAAAEAEATAREAQAQARDVGQESDVLRHDVDRLLMITEALWMLLKKQHGYADEDLAKVVQEIDLRDGKLDGKTTKSVASPCPQCGKMNSNRYTRCIYCGTTLPVKLFAS